MLDELVPEREIGLGLVHLELGGLLLLLRLHQIGLELLDLLHDPVALLYLSPELGHLVVAVLQFFGEPVALGPEGGGSGLDLRDLLHLRLDLLLGGLQALGDLPGPGLGGLARGGLLLEIPGLLLELVALGLELLQAFLRGLDHLALGVELVLQFRGALDLALELLGDLGLDGEHVAFGGEFLEVDVEGPQFLLEICHARGVFAGAFCPRGAQLRFELVALGLVARSVLVGVLEAALHVVVHVTHRRAPRTASRLSSAPSAGRSGCPTG